MRRALFFFAALLTASCSLLTSLEGYDEPRVEAEDVDGATIEPSLDAAVELPDAAAPEGDSGADAGDGTVVVTSDGFEMGSTCSPWAAERGSIQTTTPGRTDAQACLLCFVAPAAEPRLQRTVGGAPGAWRFEAWVKRHSGTGAMNLSIEVSPGGGAEHGVGSDWQRVEYAFNVSSSTSLDLRLDVETADGCLLLDDVLVTRLPPP